MPEVKGTFYGLPLATIQSLKAKYIACLEAISIAGQSYAIGGKSFSRGNLAEVKDTIRELQEAEEKANPVNRSFKLRPRFNR